MKITVRFLLLFGVLASGTVLADSRLTNVSVRSTAGTDTDTLIVGFTISGSGNKQMLVRGIGPTLGMFNVAGAVADPQLRLYDGAGTSIAANDNWGGSSTSAAAFASVGAFSLAPDSRDAALFLSLSPGSYSAHVAANGSPGVALVEAYDADPGPTAARVSNLSARSLAGTGANILTIGFAITGDTRKTVLVRAVGPSLAGFGVDGSLANPQLTLFSSTGTVLGQNDDWLANAGWAAAFNAVGAFPLSSNTRDAVLLMSLAPGTYTAQANGTNNTSGIALIEVYDVPNPPPSSLVFQPVENVAPATPAGSSTDLNRVSTVPVALTQARPQYPLELRAAGISGEALIDFIVDTNGRVQNAFVLRATDVRFGDSALAAVRQWTFRPGQVNGQPVATHMQVPIIFTIN